MPPLPSKEKDVIRPQAKEIAEKASNGQLVSEDKQKEDEYMQKRQVLLRGIEQATTDKWDDIVSTLKKKLETLDSEYQKEHGQGGTREQAQRMGVLVSERKYKSSQYNQKMAAANEK